MRNKLLKKTILLTAVFAGIWLIGGCTSSRHEYEKITFAMDTVMTMKAYSTESTDVLEKAEELIQSIESDVSVTDENSVIYSLNKNKSARLTEISSDLLSAALSYCKETDGALNISIYPVVKAWGFTTDTQQVPSDDTIAQLVKNVDYEKISLDDTTVSIPSDMEVDLGAVTKGYTSDRVISLLRENGIKNAIISLGGNVQVIGNRPDGKPWNVAIQDPFSKEYAGVVAITDKAAVTSGDYERYFEENGVRYHHIMDPATGRPARSSLSSVTIVSESGIKADALSTSLFVMGLDKATAYWKENQDFEAIFITNDGEIYITHGLSADFTPMGNYTKNKINIIE